MTDTKIVTPAVRCHKEHEKEKCPICLAGEGHGPFWPRFPETYPDIRTIYVRKDGSDRHGDGSRKHPFRTFKHAIRFVSPEIPSGHQVVVDVTGIGLETFPQGYAIPPIRATAFLQTFSSPSTLPFQVSTCLNIRAFPQPYSGIPVGDTSIPSGAYTLSTVPGSSGLALLTLTGAPRASWASNALQGQLLIGDSTALTSCAIYGSTATQLLLANIPANVTGNLTVVEPSAEFQTPSANVDGGGFGCMDCASVSFQGISFTTQQNGMFALILGGTPQPDIELCKISGGIITEANLEEVILLSSVVTNGINFQAGNATPFNCLFLNLGSTGQAVFFGEADFLVNTSVFINTQGSLGPSPPFTSNGSSGGTWEFANALIQGSVAPNGAIFAHGGGGYALQNVEIDGSSNDAIFVDGPLDVQLINVGGTGNGGIGVHATNGAQVRVDPTTTVNGTGGDVQSGSLVPTTYAALASTQQYDIPPSSSVLVSTGSRIFVS